jgi:hypothetical protein
MSDVGWHDRELQELVEVNPESLGAGTPPSHRFHYIDIGAVAEGEIQWSQVWELSFANAPSRARRVVVLDDVIFGTVRPALQSHGFVNRSDVSMVASTGFAVPANRRGRRRGDGRPHGENRSCGADGGPRQRATPRRRSTHGIVRPDSFPHRRADSRARGDRSRRAGRSVAGAPTESRRRATPRADPGL